LGNSLAEPLLASQEGLYSIELITHNNNNNNNNFDPSSMKPLQKFGGVSLDVEGSDFLSFKATI
jgi:hypothetical protein